MIKGGLYFEFLEPILNELQENADWIGIAMDTSPAHNFKIDLYFNSQEDLNLFKLCGPTEKYKDNIYFNFLVYES